MRSSQPLTGSNGRRCKEDEKIINTVLKPGQRGYIVDARYIFMLDFPGLVYQNVNQEDTTISRDRYFLLSCEQLTQLMHFDYTSKNI